MANSEVWLRDKGVLLMPCDGDYMAIEVVGPDGGRRFWLATIDDIATGWDGGWVIPDHEWSGPLPEHIRERLDVNRCGARTRTGGRCRMQVSSSGDHCWHHRGCQPSLFEAEV